MRVIRLDEKAHRMKISHYLREVHGFSSRSLRSAKVYLDGKQVRTTKKLPKTGILKVDLKEKSTNIKPIKMDLEIVYEDENLLIVSKPFNLVTHPTLKKTDITLANAIVYYLNKVPRFYNRLDMDTTGLVVIAKDSYTQSYLQQFGEVKKKYFAVVKGKFEGEILIDKKIYKPDDEIKRIIDDRGKESKTIVKLVKYNEVKDISLVECELLTGRTHQIRVHLSSIGHPIIGDSLYGNGENIRQLLHSYYIEFNHPKTKNRIKIEIEPYYDMNEIIGEQNGI